MNRRSFLATMVRTVLAIGASASVYALTQKQNASCTVQNPCQTCGLFKACRDPKAEKERRNVQEGYGEKAS